MIDTGNFEESRDCHLKKWGHSWASNNFCQYSNNLLRYNKTQRQRGELTLNW